MWLVRNYDDRLFLYEYKPKKEFIVDGGKVKKMMELK